MEEVDSKNRGSVSNVCTFKGTVTILVYAKFQNSLCNKQEKDRQ